MIRRVELSKLARKQLKKMPRHIIENLASWVDDLETRGLEEVRKIPGYHDEPLHGDRQGQRSIRLSRVYRAIYIVKDGGGVEFVSVEEVSKHDY
jgi:proteic killer suppression protein